MARFLHPQVVTANDLFSGAVIYLTSQNEWSEELIQAEIAETQEAAALLLEKGAAHQGQIVGAYLADVQLNKDSLPTPVHFREDFRTKGPSNYFHGKQADVQSEALV